ncbi:MAG TPA: AAA family ATPase, partial [Candidatus Sulfotelmatobacter sp.]|nr:AAA family ATPase [Candidatus Sulfotelmatobacter sp.]
MADQYPDLIQRAAARLHKARGGMQMPRLVSAEPASGADDVDKISELEGTEAVSRLASPQAEEERYLTISPATLAANGLALPANGFSRTVEEFRSLKRYVLANSLPGENGRDNAAKRVVMVTSARPGEGKTFTAINLALALAYEKDFSVLLLDADAYRQSLMTYLGVSAEHGWLDLMSAGHEFVDELIYKTNIPGLSLLPSGKERAGIPEFMASRRMKKL